MIKIMLVILFLYGVGSPLNYYVSGDGSESNSGLSIAHPRKTFRWIEESSLSGGDTIFIKSGYDYYEDLYLLGKSGQEGNEIVITSYNGSSAPRFYGEMPLEGWEAFDDGVHSNIFRLFVDSNSSMKGSYDSLGNALSSYGNPEAFNLYDSTQLVAYIDSMPENGVGPIRYRDSHYLYYKSTDPVSPITKKIKTFRNTGITLHTSDHVIVEDISFTYLNTGITVQFGDSVIVRNNKIDQTFGIGCQLSSTGKVFILNNAFSNTGNNAIYLVQNFNPVLIRGNTITGILDTIAGVPVSGDQNAVGYEIGTNVTIEYNYIHDLSRKSFDFYFNDSITIKNNYIKNAGFVSPYGVNSVVRNNIYDAVDFDSWAISGTMVMYDGLTDGDFIIRDNIMVGTDSLWSIRTNATPAPDTVNGKWIIEGNLIHSKADNFFRMVQHEVDTNTITDSNCYFNEGIEPTFIVGDSTYTGFADYQSSTFGLDQNSIYDSLMNINGLNNPEEYVFNRESTPCGNAGIEDINLYHSILDTVGPRIKENSIVNTHFTMDTIVSSTIKDTTGVYSFNILGSGYYTDSDTLKTSGSYSCLESDNLPSEILQPEGTWSMGGWYNRTNTGGYIVSKSSQYYSDRSAIYNRGNGYFINSIGGDTDIVLSGNQSTWNFIVWQNYYNGSAYVYDTYLNNVRIESQVPHTATPSPYNLRIGCRAISSISDSAPVLAIQGGFKDWFFIRDSILTDSTINAKYINQ